MHIEKFQGGAYVTTGYLVYDKSNAILIDAPEDIADKVILFLESHMLKLDLIVLTHVHWDHTADAMKLRKLTGAKIVMHELDEQNQAEINSIFEGEAGIVKADYNIEEGHSMQLGNIVLTILHTPGHTPGSICVHNEQKRILFSGDTLFAHTYGRVDFPLSNPDEMKASLQRLSNFPTDTLVYPGHGAHTTIGKEDWLKEV